MAADELRAWLRPNETAAQLLQRTHIEPVPTGILFLGSVRPGTVTEIAGGTGTGKTACLIQARTYAKRCLCKYGMTK